MGGSCLCYWWGLQQPDLGDYSRAERADVADVRSGASVKISLAGDLYDDWHDAKRIGTRTGCAAPGEISLKGDIKSEAHRNNLNNASPVSLNMT